MEVLCRKCPKKCKQDGRKGKVMRYCSEAPENHRVLEDFRSTKNVSSKNSKKAKATKPVPTESTDVVWNASDWLQQRNIKTGAE